MTKSNADHHSANKSMLWSLGLGGFLVNADNRAITPMLPAVAGSLHVSASGAALLITAYSIPYGLFQLVYGPIADRIGKIRTILISFCLFAVGTVFCGIVHTFLSLLILRFITGMFAAGIIPTTLAQIGDRFDLAERPRAIAFFMSLSTTGQAMGIVIGGLVAQFVSYRILFFILGAAAIPTLLTLLRQRESGSGQASGATTLRARYLTLVRYPRAWLVYGTVLCEGFVFYGGFTFLGVYGVFSLHLSYLLIGLLTATYSLGAFVGSRTVTFVLGKVGSARMPLTGSLLMVTGFAAIWIGSSPVALTVGFIMLGFGFSYCHSTLQTYATELLPGGRATAVSVFAFSLFLGSGLGPMAFGPIFDRFGAGLLLASATGAMTLFGVLCTAFLRSPHPGVVSGDPAVSRHNA